MSFNVQTIDHNVQHKKATTSFNFSVGGYDSLNYFLSSSDFSPCFESNDIEFVWTYISDLIKDGIKQYIPFTRSYNHNQPILLLDTTPTVFELSDINILNILLSRMKLNLQTWKTCNKLKSIVLRLITNLL